MVTLSDRVLSWPLRLCVKSSRPHYRPAPRGIFKISCKCSHGLGDCWRLSRLLPALPCHPNSYRSLSLTLQVRFIIVPDLLANAPMFKRVGPNAMRGRGIGAARGRATIQRGKFCGARDGENQADKVTANARRGAPRGQGVRR